MNNKIIKALAIVALAVALAVLCGKCWADDEAHRQALEKKHAGEMAQCWADYKENKNGGDCHFEAIYVDDGQTLLDLEVISKPLN